MLGELWGLIMAGYVMLAVFWIVIGLSRIFLGNVGTAVLMLGVAASAAWMGWQQLVHSDNLGLQMLGWSLAGTTVWCILKGIQIGVRKLRTSHAEVGAS